MSKRKLILAMLACLLVLVCTACGSSGDPSSQTEATGETETEVFEQDELKAEPKESKDGTKTDSGQRDIPISSKLKPYLEAALEQQQENKDDLIFYDYNKDSMISTSQVNNYYRRICEIANIPNGGQHALRHTFAIRCIESGIPAVVLKNWLGHTNIHITLDINTDVFNSMNNKAVGEFDKYLESM